MKFKRQKFLTFTLRPAVADRLHAFVGSLTGSARLDSASMRHVDQFFESGDSDGKQQSRLRRVRQEIDSGRCFADFKTLKNGSSKLHRSLISRPDVESLLQAPENSKARPDVWKLCKTSTLLASTEVHYSRTTYRLASNTDVATRITLDQGIRCRLLSDSNLPDYYDLTNTCLLTMKFADTLPAVFKRIVFEYCLQPQRTFLAKLCDEVLAAAPHTVSPFHPAQPRLAQPLTLGDRGEKSVA